MCDFSVFSFGSKMANIGDQAQRVGFENALIRAGIDIEKLDVVFGYNARSTQEKLSYIAYGYYDYNYGLELFPIMENEYPYFLSVHCTDEKRVEDLKGIEGKLPFFGCRDYATYQFIKRNFPEMPCFMTGCYSLIQHKRKMQPETGKVYCVDILEEIKTFIPDELRKNIVYRTHDDFRFSADDKEADKLASDYINEWFAELRENAKLVITSRLHCALPCVAMGIPVVVARGYRDNTDRYTGFEKLFHVYMPNEFDKINWNPEVLDIEWIKDLIVNNTKVLVEAIRNNTVNDKEFADTYAKKWDKLTAFFSPKEYVPYYEGENVGYLSHDEKIKFYESDIPSIISYITGKDPAKCNLVVYGAGDRGRYFLNRYQDEIKSFDGFFYIDSNESRVGEKICGIPIKSVSSILDQQDTTVVIVAVDRYYSLSGRQMAMRLANELKYNEGRDFLMLDKLDSSSKLEMTKAVLNAPLM